MITWVTQVTTSDQVSEVFMVVKTQKINLSFVMSYRSKL